MFGRSPGPTSADGAGSSRATRPTSCAPTRRGPAPSAKRSSVVAGLSEAMRAGDATEPARIVSPKSSTSARAPRDATRCTTSARDREKRERRRAATGDDGTSATAERNNGHLSPSEERCPAAMERVDARTDRHQPLLRGTERVARTRGVSWLRDPRSPSRHVPVASSARLFPLQWRDRAGLTPASVTRIRESTSRDEARADRADASSAVGRVRLRARA